MVKLYKDKDDEFYIWFSSKEWYIFQYDGVPGWCSVKEAKGCDRPDIPNYEHNFHDIKYTYNAKECTINDIPKALWNVTGIEFLMRVKKELKK